MVTFIKKVIYQITKNRTPYKDVHSQFWSIALPLIAAGVSAVAGLLGKKSDQNQQTDFYNKQRADNLTDVTSQNAYNAPSAQMARLQEAGLNPHLVYGGGQSITASATPKEASQGKPVATPDYGQIIGNATSQYQDIRMQQHNSIISVHKKPS